MARSEFRWNKKRKHYSYIFGTIDGLAKNLLFTTKQERKVHGKMKKNVKLFKHPNPNCEKEVYIIPYIFLDRETAFYGSIYNWKFDKNDKRAIKRIKKTWKNKNSQH